MDRFSGPQKIGTDVSNPARLFSFLKQRNWNGAEHFFRRSPHHARSWLRQSSFSGETIWHMLPLHAAVMFGAPLHLIKELVITYPDALQKPDHEGKLPLHYAAIFSNKDQQDIMRHMLKYYPEGMWTKASCGRTAIEYARNDELQTTERIRMRKRLNENSSDDARHKSSVNVSALLDIDIDEKENERDGVYTEKNHRDIAVGSNISCQEEPERYEKRKATTPNAHDGQQKSMKKKMQIPAQAKRSREFQPLNNKSINESGQEEGSYCIPNCSADVEKVDQRGQRTVYLNFDGCNEDTDDDDSLSDPQNNSEDASKSKHDTDAAANYNSSKKRIMKVMKSIKKWQKVSYEIPC